MTELIGFWSYVHADDRADGERITRLARDVVEQYKMITGDEIRLFLDKDAIKLGEDWRKKIDESIVSVAFFIAVITPRYFMSPECRREMQYFCRKAIGEGVQGIVLPLIYVDVPSIHDENNEDDLVKIVRTFQWENWCDLRFTDVSSEMYRRGVFRIATRLSDANLHAEEKEHVARVQIIEREKEPVPIPSGTDEEAPGSIDKLAKSEESLPKLNETLQEISHFIQQIGQMMKDATQEIKISDTQGKGFTSRLLVARKLAQQLIEPTEKIWLLGNAYVSQLHDVDSGFRIIIERTPTEIVEKPDSKEKLLSFIDVVLTLSSSANDGLGKIQGMVDAIGPLEAMSRDMRPVLRKLKQGLIIIIESRNITNEWAKLIYSLGLRSEKKE